MNAPPSAKLYKGDCLQKMSLVPDRSVDLILADLPYGNTDCKWDTAIELEPLWEHYKRIIKPRGAIVLFASQPFTSRLVMSNTAWFKYCWIWEKARPSNFIHAKNAPLKGHEEILVFSPGAMAHSSLSRRRMTYRPQGVRRFGKYVSRRFHDGRITETIGHRPSHRETVFQEFTGYPRSVLRFSNHNGGSVHPTQKPIDLLEYLIRTYTRARGVIMDNTMGSGSTGVACVRTRRRFIGIERDARFFKISQRRIAEQLAA